MNGLPYYKAYPRDFIEGTIGMDFETKAAYRLVLDLIYMQSGRLPDDARYISGLLGCSVRKWKALRSTLVRSGKVYVSDGYLGNYRADKELETLGKLQDKQRENRSTPNKNNGLQSPRFDHTEPESDTASEAKASSAARATINFDLDEIERRLRQAADAEGGQESRLKDVSPIIPFLQAGYDFEGDVMPVVRGVAAKLSAPPKSWRYFVPALEEAFAKRSEVPDKPKTSPRVFVVKGSEAWQAWCEFNGKPPPTTEDRSTGLVRTGWHFPTEYPPALEAVE